ncbi:hypothetical protein [Yoonia sp.]|uniref:hypothetical protein n=1 Tax=Yoonia sp. TaxID=2212373 RepID=UPI002DFBB40B|nr:hypothetical protein [Yoonia sp.]
MSTNTASYVIRRIEIPAGQFVQVHAPGDFVSCLSASAAFKLSFDSGPQNDFENGLTVRPKVAFRMLTVHNPSGAAVSVRIGIGRGDFADNRFIPAEAIGVKPVAPDTLTTGAPVSIGAGATVALAGSDTTRVEIAIRNLSTADRIWVQTPSETGAQGWPLDAKEGVILTTTDAVSIHNPNGGAISVAVFETKRSA